MVNTKNFHSSGLKTYHSSYSANKTPCIEQHIQGNQNDPNLMISETKCSTSFTDTVALFSCVDCVHGVQSMGMFNQQSSHIFERGQ